VEEVRAAQESLLFSLPKELRRDLKAAEASRAAGAPETQPSSLH
jgi:4-hydroxy-3-methylbut-2-en-1-yl diphosphate reductase